MNNQDINIANLLADKWAADQKREAQYHIHPEFQEGGSQLGGCIALRAKKESGMPLPKREGAKDDFGNAFVGNVWHEKVQCDLVPELQKLFPGMFVGPIIENGIPSEVVTETELLPPEGGNPAQMVVSPLDLCVVTTPGVVKKQITYANETKMRYVKHPDAKWVFIADIKTASPYAFNLHEQGDLGVDYEAQGTMYLKATGLAKIPFLFINKVNSHKYVLNLEFDQQKWEALQAKRRRERMLATQLKETGACDFIRDDFRYFIEDYPCVYQCPFSKTHETDSPHGGVKIVLDEPCREVVAMVEAEYTAKFTPGSQWTSGASMLTINNVRDGKVYAVNKSGKEYIDSIFTAARHYVAGWAKKEKPAKKAKLQPPEW
jgi:hypothetical protein